MAHKIVARSELSSAEISRALTAVVQRMNALQREKWDSQRQAAITALLAANRMVITANTQSLFSLPAELTTSIADLF